MAASPIVPTPNLELQTERTATETIFRCTGKITSSTAPLLKDTIRGAIPEKKTIVLDLSNVSYMDSSGLGAVVSLWVTAKRDNCEFKLISLSQRVKELFRLTGVDKLFSWSPINFNGLLDDLKIDDPDSESSKFPDNSF